MSRARSFARRASAVLLLLLLFWTASQLASRVPWITALGASVHTMGLGDYSADPLISLAPLSPGILNEARADAGTPSVSSSPATAPITAVRPTPTPAPGSTPIPTLPPTPTPTVLPTPTPTGIPTPIPTPTLIATPTPTP